MATLANRVAGIAISGLFNAITRIEAASTSHGIASKKRNGPNETVGKACCCNCRRSAIVMPRTCLQKLNFR